jgi:hypothetical protein
MSIFILVVLSGLLMALMVGLRLLAKKRPNADLLLATMCDHLEAGCNGEGNAP